MKNEFVREDPMDRETSQEILQSQRYIQFNLGWKQWDLKGGWMLKDVTETDFIESLWQMDRKKSEMTAFSNLDDWKNNIIIIRK